MSLASLPCVSAAQAVGTPVCCVQSEGDDGPNTPLAPDAGEGTFVCPGSCMASVVPDGVTTPVSVVLAPAPQYNGVAPGLLLAPDPYPPRLVLTP